ncbi:L-serine dehydratase 1 [Corynebacterium occultum]|uniref:L-serine dehydratase n=1 Tax=Corynebacterium occultum TaxID=2675219 RepID=A0A6B8W8D4_9CORY|nr:L-serine ammonia-lyase [Corynebacterium occultum]QGU07535.1 L-serine dehydratase 1 [Corynebacterium occultum]
MISVSDLFSIGIGPSSSHTVGPMRAAHDFTSQLPQFPARVEAELRGSLSATGAGHGTDRAVILGLVGYEPTTLPADVEPAPGEAVPAQGTHSGPAGQLEYSLIFNNEALPQHPNGMILRAFDESGQPLGETMEYFSVGGGFIQTAQQLREQLSGEGIKAGAASADREIQVPYPFNTAAELLEHSQREGKSFAEIVLANEIALTPPAEGAAQPPVLDHLDRVWAAMKSCVSAGLAANGTLPGGLGVVRRAPLLFDSLMEGGSRHTRGEGLDAMEWVNLYALAVNEQNAAGGRVVTAPTNGAAGIIPAVLHYARDFLRDFSIEKVHTFLLTAGAVGIIIKQNASISGAEVGCQGEVGSASAMAAAGLAAIIGGSPSQVENAAEIALEHNLGLTCDPVGGLVQIPCIERNAIGSVKSINAARLACMGEGIHRVTLDDVIRTMAETGRDMLSKYKETSMGGLAVNIGISVAFTEC